MKRLSRIVIPLGLLTALLLLNVTRSLAQEPEAVAEGPAQAQVAPSPQFGGPMGRMPHGMGWMPPGTMPFVWHPGYGCPCCGWGMGWGMGGMGGMGMPPMGMPMMGGAMERDPKRAAKMMEMHAEMMKAVAEVIEKYAKEMQSGQ